MISLLKSIALVAEGIFARGRVRLVQFARVRQSKDKMCTRSYETARN